MRVRVDPTQCGCSGYCVRLVPEVFSLGEGGVAHAIESEVLPSLMDAVREAAAVCPTSAISVDESAVERAGS
jgi:ferredoxin